MKLQDEGVTLGQGWIGTINCSGSGVTCTRDATTGVGTISVSSSGPGGGLPDTIPVITYASSSDLSAERLLAAGSNISVALDGGSIYVGVTGTVPSATIATTATQLASDPTACPADEYVTDIAANGALTCSAVTVPDATSLVTGGIRLTTDLGGTATAPTVVDDSHNHTGSTISSLDTSDISSGTLAQARGGTGAAALTCSGGQALTSNGTAYSCTSTLTASDVACSGQCVGVAEVVATGTPSATTYLRGDGTWSTPSGGSGPTIYANAAGTTDSTPATDPGDSLHSKTITVTAGDTVLQEGWWRQLNNSGGTRTYTLRCRIGTTTLVAVSDSTTVAASASNQAAYFGWCKYSVVSSSSTLVMGFLHRIPGTAAGTSATGATRVAWATSASNFTGSQTFNLNWSADATTATQTWTLESYRLTHQASNP